MNKKTKLIIIIGIIVVLCITTALIIIPNISDSKFEDIAKEYYNNKINSYIEENKTLSNVDVAFIGDSITDLYNVKEFYPNLITANRGIGADNTFGLQRRLKVSLYDINPSVVVLEIGGNNLDTMFDNYEDILKDIQLNLPTSKVIVQSIYPTNRNFANRNEKIIKINTQLKALAEKYNYTFVDMFYPFYDSEIKEFSYSYCDDGLHPNQICYELITEILTPIINNMLLNFH